MRQRKKFIVYLSEYKKQGQKLSMRTSVNVVIRSKGLKDCKTIISYKDV